MRLVRYNPLNERALFRNAFDDFFTRPVSKTRTGQCFSPAVDIINKDETIELTVELPGMKKEAISLNIEDKVLTISGECKVQEEEKKDNYLRRERNCGSFKRSFTLSDDILTDEISAEYVDGILRIILKKDTVKEEMKQISIN